MSTRKSFHTIRQNATAEFSIKRSRFIADIRRVVQMADAEATLAEIRAAMPDANHHCYAIRINEQLVRYSDDGEPSGTAGRPIFDVINAAPLSQCICVVTRYFGGTKLGTGGLVSAYSEAARLSRDAAGIVEVFPSSTMRLHIPHPDTQIIHHVISEFSAEILESSYSNVLEVQIRVEDRHRREFLERVTNLSAGRIQAAPN